MFDFAQAINYMLAGERVTRAEWSDPECWLQMRAGILHLHKPDGTWHTLIVSEEDLRGTDWRILEHAYA